MSVWAAIFELTVGGCARVVEADVGAFWVEHGPQRHRRALFRQRGLYDTLFNIQTASIDLKTGKLTTPPVEGGLHVRGSKTSLPVWSPDGK